MRRVLILGGTGWLGREIAQAALNAGESVTCLARGASGDVPEGAHLIRADRMLPGAYSAASGEWDDVIELAYDAAIVQSALDALAARTQHWTLVSTISVYSDSSTPNADESAALVTPADLSQYADAKVAAERATVAQVGDRLLIARPGLIVGPGDPSDRFGYWPARLQRGGRVLTPTTEGRHVQVIDVADLAGWLVKAGQEQRTGTIDAVGAAHPMDKFFDAAVEATSFAGELVKVDDDALVQRGVNYWAGPRSLPLWLPLDSAALAQRSGAAFRAAGGVPRPLEDTLVRVLDDEVTRGIHRPRRSGLTATEESELLAA